MLGTRNVWDVLLINLILGAVWHCGSFFLCVAMPLNHFSPDRWLYRPHRWEKEGRFYSDVLHINKWKDHLPQHTGKNGFSKSHLDSVSVEYIDRFISETCRGEWNHTTNCLFTAVLFIINTPIMGLLLSVLLVAGNFPFIFIQRYNRFRLQKLRSLIIKKNKRSAPKVAGLENHTAAAPGNESAIVQQDSRTE